VHRRDRRTAHEEGRHGGSRRTVAGVNRLAALPAEDTLNIKVKFVASEKDNDKAHDYAFFAGSTEFGATWKKTARDSGREYLSVKLDDPSFPAPIYALAGRGRRRRRLYADLVAPQRRLID
jgi:uncharacterized protein (DUF736 family)